jgi:lysophospholipase L1-like esterase
MTPLRLLVIAGFCFFKICFCNAYVFVTCIGDSITAGVGVNNAAVESYPAKLQSLLTTNVYYVINDGVSGTTLLKQGDMPYWNTSQYKASRTGSKQPLPDILIIMLGTNDSKSQNWVYGTNFVSDYEALIASYTNLPRILICTPPPAFNNGTAGINPGIVATNIAPLVRQIGTNENLQVIDLQTLMAGHSEWFPDNVHPNTQGTAVMAAIVYSALLGDTMNGATPSLGISATNHNTILNWPADGAGWVLQTTSTLGPTSNWDISSQLAINNGTFIRSTNSTAGQGAFFRLWNPTLGNY